MKNYKVKVTELYPGMDFYHVEGSGAYSGGEIIIHIRTNYRGTTLIHEFHALIS